MRPAVVLRGLFLVATLGAAVTLSTLYSFNHFDKDAPQAVGDCTPVTGIVGPEDLQVDRVGRRVFLSSFDRRSEKSGADARGAIHVLSVDDPLASPTWKDQTDGAPAKFEPLGLSFYRNGNVQRLFVVNAATQSVELFDVADDGALTHLETLAERRMTSPNDIVGTGPRSFYVTNDVDVGRDTLLGRFQFLGRAAAGRILHFNGVSWSLAAEGLQFANGITTADDGRTLYVTESSGMALRTYDRDPATGLLAFNSVMSLPGAGENINAGPDGKLLVATSPKPLAISLHKKSAAFSAPSLIQAYETRDLRQDNGVHDASAITNLFRSSGDVLSAATVADAIDDLLFIGTLADDRFLICRGAI